MKKLTTEYVVAEFFKRRFPDKNLKFEKECGYFYECVTRFESGNPEAWADEDSLAVIEEMKKEGIYND
jgi:hypothetical protein